MFEELSRQVLRNKKMHELAKPGKSKMIAGRINYKPTGVGL